MSVYVIRHADKEKGEFRNNNLPLNDQPIDQIGQGKALRLKDYFIDIEISQIIASEYVRTKQTIHYVAEDKNLQIAIDYRLNEINIGDLENINEETLPALYPEFWSAYLSRDRDFRFPNGESGVEAEGRIWDLFNSLDKDSNTILVSHDGIIRVLLCKICGIPSYKRHLFTMDYCSINQFDYDKQFNCWTIKKVNYVMEA